jgi:uncharacterized membrane protein
MALTGHLSDLSLSELIEFFCNQRKTGRLKVRYPKGAGYFNLQTGSVVDAKIGVLRGIDAVYYALTLPNAAFEFSASAEATERTINQPWTQVVLEGLRRLDEGMIPPEAFPPGFVAENTVVETDDLDVDSSSARAWHVPAFLSMMSRESMSWRKPLIAGAVAVAVILSVAAIGVPAGWYGRSKPVASNQPDSSASSQSQPAATTDSATAKSGSSETEARATDAAALAAKRQREKERAAKAREERANAATGNASPKPALSPASQSTSSDVASKPGPKKATVQVTYDESGRVVQASGADATALRIARQKRFPPGKAGTATITIPIN